jgi:penicillin-binding protein 2
MVPTREWKKDTVGEDWYLGDTFHFGIGQGYMLATPLQVHTWGEVIANGGTLYKPRLVQTANPIPIKFDFLSDTTVGLIRKGMVASCSPGGVAYPLYEVSVENKALSIDGRNIMQVKNASDAATIKNKKDLRKIVVACKTGTAQHGGAETLPHAWITTFAPAYAPEIVVTVLVEEGGEGSQKAAPIAKKVIEAYFKNR